MKIPRRKGRRLTLHLDTATYDALVRHIGAEDYGPHIPAIVAVRDLVEKKGLLRYDFILKDTVAVEGPVTEDGCLLSPEAAAAARFYT